MEGACESSHFCCTRSVVYSALRSTRQLGLILGLGAPQPFGRGIKRPLLFRLTRRPRAGPRATGARLGFGVVRGLACGFDGFRQRAFGCCFGHFAVTLRLDLRSLRVALRLRLATSASRLACFGLGRFGVALGLLAQPLRFFLRAFSAAFASRSACSRAAFSSSRCSLVSSATSAAACCVAALVASTGCGAVTRATGGGYDSPVRARTWADRLRRDRLRRAVVPAARLATVGADCAVLGAGCGSHDSGSGRLRILPVERRERAILCPLDVGAVVGTTGAAAGVIACERDARVNAGAGADARSSVRDTAAGTYPGSAEATASHPVNWTGESPA